MIGRLAFTDAPEASLAVFLALIVGLVFLVRWVVRRSIHMYRQGKS